MTVGEAKKAAKAHHGVHRPDTFGVPSDEPASHLSSRHGHIKGATFDSTAPPLQGDRVQFHLFIRAIWAAITFTLMSGGGGHMRIQNIVHDACPICGKEVTLAVIEPHPTHSTITLHTYRCVDCGAVKTTSVLRSTAPRASTPLRALDR